MDRSYSVLSVAILAVRNVSVYVPPGTSAAEVQIDGRRSPVRVGRSWEETPVKKRKAAQTDANRIGPKGFQR